MSVFFRCPSYQDQNLATLEIVHSILSSGTHSILFQSLREQRGFIYGLYAELALSPDFGSLDIITSTSARNMNRALTTIFEEVSTFKSSDISEEDLSAAKERLIKIQILKCEDVKEASKWYAEREMLSSRENADDLTQWIHDVNEVSVQDVHDLLNKLFVPGNCFIYVLGSLWPWQKWALLRRIKELSNFNDLRPAVELSSALQ